MDLQARGGRREIRVPEDHLERRVQRDQQGPKETGDPVALLDCPETSGSDFQGPRVRQALREDQVLSALLGSENQDYRVPQELPVCKETPDLQEKGFQGKRVIEDTTVPGATGDYLAWGSKVTRVTRGLKAFLVHSGLLERVFRERGAIWAQWELQAPEDSPVLD